MNTPTNKFEYTPLGYTLAVKWLKENKHWSYVSNHGQSVDGWSIINTANSLYEESQKELCKK